MPGYESVNHAVSNTGINAADHDRVRVILAGGSPLLQAGIVAAFSAEPRLHVVAQLPSVKDCTTTLRQQHCHVLVLNSDGPRLELALVVEHLAGLSHRPHLLVLTEAEAREELLAALQYGIDGYGIRGSLWPEELCAAVLTVARGNAWTCPRATRLLMDVALQQELTCTLPMSRRAPLSQRELEVLRLAAAGAAEDQIASSLVLSRNTVKTYLRRIREKLQVHSRAEAVSLAIQRGMLPDRRVLAAS